MREKLVNLFLLRHGEAEHNVAIRTRCPPEKRETVFRDPTLFDAPLTVLGKAQADAAAHDQPPLLKSKIDKCQAVFQSTNISEPSLAHWMANNVYFFCSPLTRAMQTAERALPQTKCIEIVDLLREWAGDRPCDGRKNLVEVRQKWSTVFRSEIAIHSFSDEDDINGNVPRETEVQVTQRLLDFFSSICRRLEADGHGGTGAATSVDSLSSDIFIVIVTHCALLRQMFKSFDLFNPSERQSATAKWRHLKFPVRAIMKLFAPATPQIAASFLPYPPLPFPLAGVAADGIVPSLKSFEASAKVISPMALLIYPPIEDHEEAFRRVFRNLVAKLNAEATEHHEEELRRGNKQAAAGHLSPMYKAIADVGGDYEREWLELYRNRSWCVPGDDLVRRVRSQTSTSLEMEMWKKEYMTSNSVILCTAWRCLSIKPTDAKEAFHKIFEGYQYSIHCVVVLEE